MQPMIVRQMELEKVGETTDGDSTNLESVLAFLPALSDLLCDPENCVPAIFVISGLSDDCRGGPRH